MVVFLEPDLPELAASRTQRTGSQSPWSLYETSCTPQEYHSQYQEHGEVKSKSLRLPMSDSGIYICLGIRNKSPSAWSQLLNPLISPISLIPWRMRWRSSVEAPRKILLASQCRGVIYPWGQEVLGETEKILMSVADTRGRWEGVSGERDERKESLKKNPQTP